MRINERRGKEGRGGGEKKKLILLQEGTSIDVYGPFNVKYPT